MQSTTTDGAGGSRRKGPLGFFFAVVAAFACNFAPLGPEPPAPMGPAGENRPAPELEENPLDPGPVVEVTCTVQGHVLNETEEVERCREDEDCRLVCR